ncbi:MAG: hypothetical protein K2G52_10715 [Muribaculaceae bacterium]|nr:hypothetical protein [Muribaculaceae bacterium]
MERYAQLSGVPPVFFVLDLYRQGETPEDALFRVGYKIISKIRRNHTKEQVKTTFMQITEPLGKILE